MRRWPDSLPTPSFPGFGLQPGDKTIRTPFQVGEARVRQITKARIDRMAASWIFTDPEMRCFRNWYDDLVVTAAGDSDDLTGWGLFNATSALSPTLGPDDCIPTRMVPTTTNDLHYISKGLSGLALDNLDVAFTASIAPAGYSKVRVRWFKRDGTNISADIDVSSGTILSSSGLTVTLKERDRGAWRISGRTTTGAGGSNPVLRFFALDASGTSSFAGDGVSGLDLCEVMVREYDKTGDDLFIRAGSDNKALGAAEGGGWFLAPAPVGGGFDYLECRFIGIIDARAGNNLEWVVNAQVEVRYA